jgi:hypothetical protein
MTISGQGTNSSGAEFAEYVLSSAAGAQDSTATFSAAASTSGGQATFRALGLASITATDTVTSTITGTQAGILINPRRRVAFDRTASLAGTTSPLTLSFDPGSAPNSLLVVGFSSGQGAPPGGLTVTFAGAPMTLVPGSTSDNGSMHSQLYYLVAPPNGSANIVATWAGGNQAVLGAVSFYGVNQVTPVRNATATSGTGISLSVTVSSAPGNMTLDNFANHSTGIGTPTQTQRWLSVGGVPLVNGGGSTANGAASVTHGWTANQSLNWSASGVDIVAAP